jgi:predicted amidohydrolase YtcJ
VNLFANHHFYWGDQHRDVTVGPERAERMNACRTALDTGVPFSIHSDAPITPLAPLFTAWCAVNRLTASGRVLGATQRISVMDALRAVTLGAAWTPSNAASAPTSACWRTTPPKWARSA